MQQLIARCLSYFAGSLAAVAALLPPAAPAADTARPTHWSFVRPEKSVIPQTASGAGNVIDHFIRARLHAEGLSQNGPADRERLIRRVTFDLTGLPPTLQEIDDFLHDSSPNAYERVVDRLLASKRFGERMAVAWLDVARYGDTSVFHGDGPRDMWAWRDWVIDAFNDNKPYSEFTIEQVAGDLIEGASVAQRVASAFNRNNATTDEGGAIAEEFRVEYAVDRVKTTSMVWLGLSMECAQCHEHKYDPISQEEYYKFFAFFNQAADPGMQTRSGNTAPIAEVPDYALRARLPEIQQERARLESLQAERREKVGEAYDAWLARAASELRDSGLGGANAAVHLKFSGSGEEVADSGAAGEAGTFRGTPQRCDGKFGQGIRLDGENYVDLGDRADFEGSDAFSYGAWVKPQGKPTGAPLARMNVDRDFRGFDLILRETVQVHLIHQWPTNAVKVFTKNKLAADQWQHVFVTWDGSGKAAGVKIYVNGEPQELNVEQDRLDGSIRTDAPLLLGRRHPQESPFRGDLDDVRIFARELTPDEVKKIAGQGEIDEILAKDAADRSEQEIDHLRDQFLLSHDEQYQRQAEQLTARKQEEAKAEKPRTTVMVMGDVQEPRMTYVLARGDYASPREDAVVQPGVPAFLPPLPEGAPPNRLGLAQWLVQPEHPLTARVAVNQYWTLLFGAGLVGSVEEFGAQGEPPSHPALLDWLAVDFVESGWDIKGLIKRMIMSETYRQSSRVTRQSLEKDPRNRLLSRGPRFRLQAEFLRDSALAVSGLLVDTVGGPSVKPYQPDGLWNEVSINTNLRFKQDHGDKLYRRSMYIYWKRSAPPPTMAIFDAPSREKCTIRRSRTNTPLQALVTLNDVQFVEAARALAERVMKHGGLTVRDRIATAYRLATGTRPSPNASQRLVDAYYQELATFSAEPQRAEALLATGESKRDESLEPAEHAAMTIVTSIILNLDETLTRS